MYNNSENGCVIKSILSFKSDQSLSKTDVIIIINHWLSKKYKYRREEERSYANQANENVNNFNEETF